MTDKEKIRAEIESRLKRLTDGCVGQRYAYRTLLEFIDSLPEEPVSEDMLDISKIDVKVQYANVESGIHAHAEMYSFNIESELFNQLTKEQQELWRKEIEQAVISGGHYGVEIARDKRYKENQEPVSEDVNEAAMMHFKDVLEYEVKTGLKMANMTSFKAGAQWQKEKMLKDAIEREVHEDGGGYPYIDATEFYDYDKDIPLAKEGDKIKVIMVKED